MSASLAAKLAYFLDNELAWRKKELISIYIDMPPDETSQACKLKCRQAIVMLYAHWEGYVKRSFRQCLLTIAAANLNPRTLRPELLGLCMQSKVRAAAVRRVPHEIGLQLKTMTDPGIALPRLPAKGIVKSYSNLSGRVLREILETVGLEPDKYAAYEADPISILLRSRNSIAHGDGIPIPYDSYCRLHHSIIDLMDDIRKYLEDQMAASYYLQ